MEDYLQYVWVAASRIPIPGFPTANQSQHASCDEDTEGMSSRSRALERRLIDLENELQRMRQSMDSLPNLICSKIMRLRTGSKKKLEDKTLQVDTLEARLQSLETQMQQERARSRDRVAGLTMSMQQLEDEKAKLREVILGNSVKQKISDEDIKQRFANIRQQIQALANSTVLDLNRMDIFPRALGDSRIEWSYLSTADRVFRMRAVIYGIIHRYILSRDIFGLEGYLSSREHDRKMQLDDALGDFEGLLRENEVMETFISDWRRATLKCIGTFGPASRDGSAASSEIWNFLEAFARYGQDSSKLFADICQLCDNAFNLRLLTRQSDDRYQFELPEVGVEYDPDKGSVEAYGVIGGGKESNIVAFSFCGALIKYTVNGDTEASFVLEPAQVVVQAKESKKSSYATKDHLTDSIL
ncbi:hypothetical protein E4U57_002312 [Claviceps arundinis]|uniref:Uncharacterized protein n=1 Tax=Claviceps arundinis TaxID=1623583 RepID=A0ABQ7PCN8_9HYPO|nr:hypothetical protein E4U57_002312 [Claviceps arundinis]